MEFIKDWFNLLDNIVYKYLDYILKTLNIKIERESISNYKEAQIFVKLFVRLFVVLFITLLELVLCVSLVILTLGAPGVVFVILYLPIGVVLCYYSYSNIRGYLINEI